MNTQELQKHIVEEFDSSSAQEAYAEFVNYGLWAKEKELIEKYFQPQSSILDIGCGTGRTTIPLFEAGYNVLGIDISEKMIENARIFAQQRGLKISYELGDATKMHFEDSSWDNALFSNQGWTQIPSGEMRQKALEEIFRILKPGGYFIFSAHPKKWFGKNFFFWIWQWIKSIFLKPLGFKIEENEFGDRFFKRESAKHKHEIKQFIHIPNINNVKKLLIKTGFSIVETCSGRSETGGGMPTFFVCKKD